MRIRFTILNLLWVTFVAALVAGWWADHRAMQKRVEAVNAKWKEIDALQLQSQQMLHEYESTNGHIRPFPPELVARRNEINDTRHKNHQRVGELQKEIEALTAK